MRFLIVLPVLLITSCAASISDADHKTCRDRGLAEGTQKYAACVEQASQARLDHWERTNRVDMSH